jgi:hypothetical protein
MKILLPAWLGHGSIYIIPIHGKEPEFSLQAFLNAQNNQVKYHSSEELGSPC